MCKNTNIYLKGNGEMLDKKKLGERIRLLRTEKELSQEQLADILETKRANIGHWENARREPTMSTIYKLAELFNTTIDYLTGKTDIKDKYESERQLNANYMYNYLTSKGILKTINENKEDIDILLQDISKFYKFKKELGD